MGQSGIKLSGGQRQRLAIARSIVKEPKILILDEATSAIDVRGEKIVQAALDRVSRNRTTIMIAHRLSTIRRADHIVVMKGGVNIEEGTHEELLQLEGGVYRDLVNAQRLELLAEDDNNKGDAMLELQEEAQSPTMSVQEKAHDDGNAQDKSRGFVRTIGLILYEQRRRWPFYLLLLVGTAGAGSKSNPILNAVWIES